MTACSMPSMNSNTTSITLEYYKWRMNLRVKKNPSLPRKVFWIQVMTEFFKSFMPLWLKYPRYLQKIPKNCKQSKRSYMVTTIFFKMSNVLGITRRNNAKLSKPNNWKIWWNCFYIQFEKNIESRRTWHLHHLTQIYQKVININLS